MLPAGGRVKKLIYLASVVERIAAGEVFRAEAV
jgi:hypothetical protein